LTIRWGKERSLLDDVNLDPESIGIQWLPQLVVAEDGGLIAIEQPVAAAIPQVRDANQKEREVLTIIRAIYYQP
jgi:hypothetical protein